MKKLVSSGDAAKLLGLSLQGIHYRIKKGQLESVKQDGKRYVYVDEKDIKEQENKHQQVISKLNFSSDNSSKEDNTINLNEIALKAKDEQISTLKKTIKFMRKQYTSEISRLDKNQKKILSVFQSEVDLLKSAFNEMKNVYKLDYEKKDNFEQRNKKSVVSEINSSFKQNKIKPYIELKEFFLFMRRYKKTDKEIKLIVLEKIKNGDKRFIYKKETKEIFVFKSDFSDLI